MIQTKAEGLLDNVSMALLSIGVDKTFSFNHLLNLSRVKGLLLLPLFSSPLPKQLFFQILLLWGVIFPLSRPFLRKPFLIFNDQLPSILKG